MRRSALSALFSVALFACGDGAPAATPAAAIDAGAPQSPAPTTTSSSGPTPTAVDSGVLPPADASPPPAACPATAKLAPGETTETLMVGNASRTYIVHVPPGYTGKKPVPLVFDFHPLGVPAGTWKLATGWAGVSDQAGFILVVAQGDGDSWNIGLRCCEQAHADEMDDVAFVRAMAAKVSADACIDSKRIYATGCSNGGGMTYKLACDAADLIAAAAPVDFDCLTGATNNPSCGNCNPSRPMSVYQFRNKQDKSAPYDGGPTTVVAGLEFPGAKANFADWATRNSCKGSAQSIANQPMCDEYSGCAGGTEIALCTQPFGYHCANYIPFGLANIAWGMLQNNSLP